MENLLISVNELKKQVEHSAILALYRDWLLEYLQLWELLAREFIYVNASLVRIRERLEIVESLQGSNKRG